MQSPRARTLWLVSVDELYSRVALLGSPMDGEWNFTRSLPRALRTREAAWLFASSKRSYVFERGGEGPLRFRWIDYDAAVLCVSAQRSLSDELRHDLCELRARSSCPLLVYLAHCDATDALADLVEIETREALDRAGYNADTVEFVRANDYTPTFDEEAVRALVAALDERARIAPALTAGPWVAVVAQEGGPDVGAAELLLNTGVPSAGTATVMYGDYFEQPVISAVNLGAIYEITGYARGWCEASGPLTEGQVLFEPDAFSTVRRVRALVFCDRVREGLEVVLSVEWSGDYTTATIDTIEPDSLCANAAWVTMTMRRPVIALRGMPFYWGERAFAGIVCGAAE